MDDEPEPCTCPADIAGDGAVGAIDHVIFSGAWMFRGGNGNWNARRNFNGNGIVNAADFAHISQDWDWKAAGAKD